MDNDINHFVNTIHSAKSIIILSGAGISTNAGIPDYRSGNGLFKQASLSENAFSRKFCNENPILFSDHLAILKEIIGKANPTASHYLPIILDKSGKLCRVYTQNIDDLYERAGLSANKLIKFHGTLENPVLYGDPINKNIFKQLETDFRECDFIIIMGTSLKVLPFCAIPNMLAKGCTRILINNEYITDSHPEKFGPIKFGKKLVSTKSFSNLSMKRKWHSIQIIGDCDKIAEQVMLALG